MLSISRHAFERPTSEPFQGPASSGRGSPNTAEPGRSRAASPDSPASTTPLSVGTIPEVAGLVSMLTDLFKQFFSQLQNLLRKEVPPSDSKSRDKPLPQPPVQPNTPHVEKQSDHIPELSTKRKGEKPKSVWDGFRQGKNGNCVTISAIKAAMEKFGQHPKSIYQSVEKTAAGYKVVMRDGFDLTLTKSELDQAIRGSNFVAMTDREMLKDAHFLFACSAKRAQIENNDGWANRSFDAAIRTLNDGEDERGPGEGFKRLGLKDHMKRVSARDFADKSMIGMVNRRGHSVAVVDGCEENYGRKSGRPTSGKAIALIDKAV